MRTKPGFIVYLLEFETACMANGEKVDLKFIVYLLEFETSP